MQLSGPATGYASQSIWPASLTLSILCSMSQRHRALCSGPVNILTLRGQQSAKRHPRNKPSTSRGGIVPCPVGEASLGGSDGAHRASLRASTLMRKAFRRARQPLLGRKCHA